MSIRIDIQIVSSELNIPSPAQLRHWAKLAISPHRKDAELTIRIVDSVEIQTLNREYRHKDKPTNVLSFPFEAPLGIELPLLGDIIICAEVVNNEAVDQNKVIEAHWAHMVIHGALHLLGYDHINEPEAMVMETLESTILKGLGYPNPYGDANA